MSRDGSKRMVFVPDFYESKLGETKIKEMWVGADWYEFSEIAAWQPKQDSSSSSSGCTFVAGGDISHIPVPPDISDPDI